MNATLHLLEKVTRATVGIHSVVPASHPSASIGLGTDRNGTGTLVSADGLIITVNYMLMGAQSVTVTLGSGQEMPATIVAQDFTTNIALLKVDGHGLPFLQAISSLTCSPGQEVFMVSSLGGEKRCADVGHITYLGPFDAAWEFVLERCVCVTASALNIGLNGGPICNSRGQVIGISYLNFADLSRAILAIPGECFILSRDELVRHGRRVSVPSRLWLGVLSYTLREHVVIAGVMPGSPGEKAGLKQGDVVLAADEREIHDRRTLYETINSHHAGEIVKLVNRRVSYQPGSTGVQTSAQEAWDARSGVCQDMAHVSVGLLRAAGLPARYVSGYLHPDPKAEPGHAVAGQSHAWAEYWAGEWVPCDPTSLAPVAERHVVLGRGRDYSDVSPLKGIYSGAPSVAMKVTVEVTRLA